MSLKNKTAKPAKEVKKAPKESYSVDLSNGFINRLGVMINFCLQNGAVQLKNQDGSPAGTLAELTVDLKREIEPQLK